MKELLRHAKEQLMLAQEQEELTGEAIDSMNRTYWEGFIAALRAAALDNYEGAN